MISLVVCQLSHYYDVTSAKETKQERMFRYFFLDLNYYNSCCQFLFSRYFVVSFEWDGQQVIFQFVVTADLMSRLCLIYLDNHPQEMYVNFPTTPKKI